MYDLDRKRIICCPAAREGFEHRICFPRDKKQTEIMAILKEQELAVYAMIMRQSGCVRLSV